MLGGVGVAVMRGVVGGLWCGGQGLNAVVVAVGGGRDCSQRPGLVAAVVQLQGVHRVVAGVIAMTTVRVGWSGAAMRSAGVAQAAAPARAQPGEVEESDFGARPGEFGGQVIAAVCITAARSAISSGQAGFGQRRQSPKSGGRYYGHTLLVLGPYLGRRMPSWRCPVAAPERVRPERGRRGALIWSENFG